MKILVCFLILILARAALAQPMTIGDQAFLGQQSAAPPAGGGTSISVSSFQFISTSYVTHIPITNVNSASLLIIAENSIKTNSASVLSCSGSPMTLLTNWPWSANTAYLNVFYITNPPAGSNDISGFNGTDANIILCGVYFSGANSTAPIRSFNGGSTDATWIYVGGGGTQTSTISSAVGDLVVSVIGTISGAGHWITGTATGQSSIGSGNNSSISQDIFCSTNTGAASVSMNWQNATNAYFYNALVNISLKP